jgi:SnoaL-like domain
MAEVLNRPMLSLAEISDRLEIQQLLVNYSTAIDQRRFDDLDEVFTADAYIDYRAMGGIDGSFPEVKAWLAEVLPGFANYAHMLGLPSIQLAGDAATARTFCFNPMVFGGAQPTTMLLGLWYEDEFVRTADGWRMSRRAETKCFDR